MLPLFPPPSPPLPLLIPSHVPHHTKAGVKPGWPPRFSHSLSHFQPPPPPMQRSLLTHIPPSPSTSPRDISSSDMHWLSPLPAALQASGELGLQLMIPACSPLLSSHPAAHHCSSSPCSPGKASLSLLTDRRGEEKHEMQHSTL